LHDWFDTLFMIVITVFSYRCCLIVARADGSYTPILAFKSNSGHPVLAVAAHMTPRSRRQPPLNAFPSRTPAVIGQWIGGKRIADQII
jgi:hypothetical protein